MPKRELCACNGLLCGGICRDVNYKRSTRIFGPICSAVYYLERKKSRKTEQKENRNV